MPSAVTLAASLHYLVAVKAPVQVLYVEAFSELVNPSSGALDALCELLRQGSVWALNAGDVKFSVEQLDQLFAAIKDSSIAFMYLCDTNVPKHFRRQFKDLLQARRRETVVAPWLLGNDEAQNAVVCESNKMWYGPLSLGRNKRAADKAVSTPALKMMDEGFVTLEGVVNCTLDGADVFKLDEMPMSGNWHSIADTADPNRWDGQPTRSQLRQMMTPEQAPTEGLTDKLKAAVQTTRERLRGEGMLGAEEDQTHEIKEEALLRAKRGCKWQSYVHGDRALEHAMQGGGFALMHYSVMVALMGDTTLWIKPIGSERLIEKTIKQGNAFCWRGDIGHAGTAHPGCESGHYRLFMHVDAKGRPITEEDRKSLFPISVA